ncbi:MAG: PQQ-binding-like beta-propeller repeat protein [Limisphaerales bacterium]
MPTFPSTLPAGEFNQRKIMSENVDNLVFVGFNSQVAGVDVDSGKIVWKWEAPAGHGYVTVLPFDDTRLIVSVDGYTYCLDAATGGQIWFNEFKGFGTGVVSLAALGRSSMALPLQASAEVDAEEQRRRHAANR